jgi:hypothetical protein
MTGNLIIRAVGNEEKGYGAFVLEYCGDNGEQLLVKHIVKEGLKSAAEAFAEAQKYKAEHPNFSWRS